MRELATHRVRIHNYRKGHGLGLNLLHRDVLSFPFLVVYWISIPTHTRGRTPCLGSKETPFRGNPPAFLM